MTADEEKACAFPVCETPEQFDQFFDKTSKHPRTRIRAGLYAGQARAAFRPVQPFHAVEQAATVGVKLDYEQECSSVSISLRTAPPLLVNAAPGGQGRRRPSR